jgi:hypothetical protein
MAAKSKPKPAAKKAAEKPAAKAEKKPIVVESATVSATQDGATLVINGVEHTLTAEVFLGLRGAINDQAAALVR